MDSRWLEVYVANRCVIYGGGSSWFCEEGRGWRFCEDEVAQDCGECRNGKAQTESRELKQWERKPRLSLILRELIRASRSFHTPLLSRANRTALSGADRSRGVFPSAFLLALSAPKSRRNLTMSASPAQTAACKGLICPHPEPTSAPACTHREKLSISEWRQNKINLKYGQPSQPFVLRKLKHVQ